MDDPNCKLLRSSAKFVSLAHNYPITNLPTYPIFYAKTGSSLTFPAGSKGHGRPSRCASNSLRHLSTIDMVGIAAASPSGQNVLPSMFCDRYLMLSMSFFSPPPLWKRVSVFLSHSVPRRYGLHQPQLSCW